MNKLTLIFYTLDLIALTEALDKAIQNCFAGELWNVWDVHKSVESLYTWQDVARRTEQVYNSLYYKDGFTFWTQFNK